MSRSPISPNDLVARPFGLWDQDWALLSAGDFSTRRYNCMTVSWGSMGVMWGGPFVMVVVRPNRHTFEFMEASDNFTVCVFPRSCRSILDVLGSRSGRDMDKVNFSGLSPIASQKVTSPSYEEAQLVLECRKLYFDDFDPSHFKADFIHDCYKQCDYHRMYFGEIIASTATDEYRTPIR